MLGLHKSSGSSSYTEPNGVEVVVEVIVAGVVNHDYQSHIWPDNVRVVRCVTESKRGWLKNIRHFHNRVFLQFVVVISVLVVE